MPEGAPEVAKRLKHEHARMERRRPDGSKLTWSVAGMERLDEPGRIPKPFFITWDDPSMRPDKVIACTLQDSSPDCQRQEKFVGGLYLSGKRLLLSLF